MHLHAITVAIALAVASSTVLFGCERISNQTEQDHIQRAKDFEDKGDIKASIVELKNAIQKNPESPQARLLLGQIYLKAGMGAEAEKELRQAKKLGVNQETINPQLGEALLLTGEYKRVLDEIQPGEQTTNANRARILQLRADALFRTGRLQDACNLYHQSLDSDPNNPSTYWGLARCEVSDGDTIKAKDWLDVALKIKDKQAKTWVVLGDLEQVNKNTEGALAAYSNALKLEPENVEALQSRATINIKLENMEQARLDIEKIGKLHPKSLLAHYLNASYKFKEKKYTEARNASQEALKIDPNYRPALMLASSIEYALGNLQTAESNLNKVVRLEPRNAYALRMLAATQLRLGRPDDAQKTLASVDFAKTTDPGMHIVAGEIAFAKKEFAKAAAFFEKATELSPDNATIRTELGMIRLAQGDNRAMADLHAAANMDSTHYQADNVIILNHLVQRQFDAALESISALEKKQSQSPLTWNYRGAAYLGKNDVSRARNSFEQALKLDPQFLPAAANLAKLDLKEGQITNARKRFESILKIDPTHLQAMLALAEFSMRDNNEKAFLSWLEKAAKAHPQSLPPRDGMTRYYLAKGEKNKALAIAREAVIANPESPAALYLLGSTQLATGEITNAVSTYTLLTKRAGQSPDAYFGLALAHIANKNPSDARAALLSGLKLRPDHIQILDTLLRLELAEDKPEAALQIARQIQTKAPKSPTGFEREADILMSQKRYPQAIKSFEMALANGAGTSVFLKLHRTLFMAGDIKSADERLSNFIKRNPGDIGARAYAAEVYMATKRIREAITQYEEVLKSNPNHLLALNNLANLYLIEQDGRALSMAERALKLAPDQPNLQDTLGWILVEQGQAERGVELLRKALARSPNADTVRYHYAVGLVRMGKQRQAKQELEALVKGKRTFPELEDAKALLRNL